LSWSWTSNLSLGNHEIWALAPDLPKFQPPIVAPTCPAMELPLFRSYLLQCLLLFLFRFQLNKHIPNQPIHFSDNGVCGPRQVLRHQPPPPSHLHRCQVQRPPCRPTNSRQRPTHVMGRRGPLVHGRPQLQTPPPPGQNRRQRRKALLPAREGPGPKPTTPAALPSPWVQRSFLPFATTGSVRDETPKEHGSDPRGRGTS